jgi:hypothetical protein
MTRAGLPRAVFGLLLFVGVAAPPGAQAQTSSPAAAPTGPEVGQKIPPFRAPDQTGKIQDFNSVRGPKGAAVYFFRSADW